LIEADPRERRVIDVERRALAMNVESSSTSVASTRTNVTAQVSVA
jgi:hypothetical protein